MAELKTQKTNQPVEEFLNQVEPAQKRQDSFTLQKLFQKVTGEKSVMWGTSIVGFGQYHYKSTRSTQEGDWPLVGFSPRKQNLTLYIMAGNKTSHDLLQELGKHKTSGGCLYLKNLVEIDQDVLARLIKNSYLHMKALYPKTG